MIETLHERPRAPIGRDAAIPTFEPHPWLRTGHAQTIAGRYLPRPGCSSCLRSATRSVLDDGDRLSVLESVPERWRPSDPAAVLVHGLAGCARSPYVLRLARKLVAMGVRVVRMNLRGAGSGFGLARGIYHAGRIGRPARGRRPGSAARAPRSPVALVGFSLGASLTLKLAAEAASRPLDGLDCVLAANPPIDLAACCKGHAAARESDLRLEFRPLAARPRWPGSTAVSPSWATPPSVASARSMTSTIVTRRPGMASRRPRITTPEAAPSASSAGSAIPGLVVHAADDPFIPVEPFQAVSFPSESEIRADFAGRPPGILESVSAGRAGVAGWTLGSPPGLPRGGGSRRAIVNHTSFPRTGSGPTREILDMPDSPVNKFRAAIEVLHRGRDLLVESLADDILEQHENLMEGGFQFHEFLETHGARLHFLGLIVGHLEQSAEFLDEVHAHSSRPEPLPPKPAGPRVKSDPVAVGVPTRSRGASRARLQGTDRRTPLLTGSSGQPGYRARDNPRPRRGNRWLPGASIRSGWGPASTPTRGDLTAEEASEFLGVIEVQLERDPFARRFIENRRPRFPFQIHPGVAPDQPVILIGESVPVPLADAPDRIVEGGADGIDGVERIGVVAGSPRDRCGSRRWRGWSRDSRSASAPRRAGPPTPGCR